MRSVFIISFIVCLLIRINTSAENRKLDSLHAALKSKLHDTARYNVLLEIGNICQNSNPDSAIYYHTKAKSLAKKNNDGLRTVKTLNEIIWDYYLKSDYDRALSIYTEASQIIAKILQKTTDKKYVLAVKEIQAACMANVGGVYKEQADYKKSLEFYSAAGSLYETVGFQLGMAISLGNIGSVYSCQGNSPKVLEYYFKALKIFETLGYIDYQASLLSNIGMTFADQGDHEKVLEYYFKALKLNTVSGGKIGQADILQNIGIEYSRQAFYPKALEYFFKTLKINEELGNKAGIAICLGNIGQSYHAHGDSLNRIGNKKIAEEKYAMAMEYFFRALKIDREVGNKQDEAANLLNIGTHFFIIKKYTLAEEYFQKSYKIAGEIGSLNDLKKAHQNLSELYQQTNRAVLALKHFKLFIQCSDSLFNKEIIKTSIRQEMKFNYEKKAAADSMKTDEEKKVSMAKLEASEALLKQEKTQRFALYGGFMMVALFSIFMVNRFRVIRHRKKLIEEQKKIVEKQKQMVEEKQKEVMDSIYYARRIQRALITSEKYINRTLDKLQKKAADADE